MPMNGLASSTRSSNSVDSTSSCFISTCWISSDWQSLNSRQTPTCIGSSKYRILFLSSLCVIRKCLEEDHCKYWAIWSVLSTQLEKPIKCWLGQEANGKLRQACQTQRERNRTYHLLLPKHLSMYQPCLLSQVFNLCEGTSIHPRNQNIHVCCFLLLPPRPTNPPWYVSDVSSSPPSRSVSCLRPSSSPAWTFVLDL